MVSSISSHMQMRGADRLPLRGNRIDPAYGTQVLPLWGLKSELFVCFCFVAIYVSRSLWISGVFGKDFSAEVVRKLLH